MWFVMVLNSVFLVYVSLVYIIPRIGRRRSKEEERVKKSGL